MESNLVWSLYLYVFIILALCVAFYFTKKIGPNGKKNSSKDRIYESGIVNYYGGINSSINVKYYLVAIVFVIFDIEAVFMYPWAVSLRELGVYALVEMFVFMGILLVGLYYIYKKKILRWE
ncbi:MAG: NADH-quinone oxidoreductase subunit A [Campylobacter sp.]|nr:NADH-quinone oxidoreductase subunit A [Campylobacter sp.]